MRERPTTNDLLRKGSSRVALPHEEATTPERVRLRETVQVNDTEVHPPAYLRKGEVYPVVEVDWDRRVVWVSANGVTLWLSLGEVEILPPQSP